VNASAHDNLAVALGALNFWPESASAMARDIDLVYGALIALTGFFALLICFLIVFFAVKYRAGVDVERGGAEASTLPVELTWIGIPLILMIAVFIWAAAVYANARTAPLDARTIYVVGRQWMWKIEHPQGRTEINELHVPAGEPIKLVMTSQDVIHSFFVPAFRVKQDVVPGRYATMWFEATEPGTYHLFCAEYCGADHALMRGRVVVMKPADFETWLEERPAMPALVPGLAGLFEQRLTAARRGPFFEFGCFACHWPGTAVSAPSLGRLYGSTVELTDGSTAVADEAYLRESILDPNAKIVAGYASPSVMPSFRGQLRERDLIQLIEFIKGLQEGWPEQMAP
jgi:cytochrome c oxidase subunit 2